ncbi:MAG TPA: hypothetical protein P5544_08740 [Candidatus Nanopelagicales bacterium]|nr:hypothetical protein [Candidatus Nanopelagicales bacterium]
MHDPVSIDPAAVGDLTTGTEPLRGTLLDWRWTDHRIAGEHLRRAEEGKHVGGQD